MNVQGFDLNVSYVSDARTYIIDLNNIPNDHNHYDDHNIVSIERNDTVDNIHVDVEQFLQEVEGGRGGQLNDYNDEEYDENDEIVKVNQFDVSGTSDQEVNNKRKVLTEAQRNTVYLYLLQISINGKLKRYATTKVANKFNLNIRQVQRIWKKRKGRPPGEVPKKINDLVYNFVYQC
ncbi:hypothetical protein LIER_10522 [Lithospermum erythrorhizon]|uniref:DUF7769 domain-containing protein n=1 Tax=Lithospermum erythrorhizon TaxID=34254 RepID=A0AAV3PKV8_LITER